EETLRSVADKGGGSYFHYIGNDGVIGDLARALRTMEAVEPLDDAGSVPDERSAPMVTIAVALLLLEWLISERRAMPSPRGLGRPAARRGRRILGIAIGSAALWAIACGDAALSNETANGLFAGGNYAGALAAYRDLQLDQPDSPELAINAANALHKMAEYPRALAEYGKAIDGKDLHLRAIAQYDRGNTLFRMGRYEDARDAYREALRMDPTDRDAKFNLEIVQRILSARPAQPGQQSGPGPRQPGSPNPGAQGPAQSGQPSAGASAQPGQNPGQPQEPTSDPTNSTDPNAQASPELRPALDDFRRGLTIDEALRVLDRDSDGFVERELRRVGASRSCAGYELTELGVHVRRSDEPVADRPEEIVRATRWWSECRGARFHHHPRRRDGLAVDLAARGVVA